MSYFMKRATLPAILGLAVLALCGPRAHGQVFVNPFFQVRPGLTLAQAAYNISVLGQALQNVPPYVYGTNPYPRVSITNTGGYGSPYGSLYGAGYGSPYGSIYSAGYGSPYGSAYGGAYGGGMYGSGSNGYGSPYGSYDSTSSYLSASANIVKEQGDLMLKQQQAFKLHEQVRSDRIENRRRVFDQYLYERDKTPTSEEERQRTFMQQVQRARNNPPATEIWSGKALNDLLSHLQLHPASKDSAAIQTSLLALDEDGLRHINLTRGAGNIGLLKNDGHIKWPVALAGSDYQQSREQLDALASMAVGQAQFNHQVDTQTMQQLSTATDGLRTQLKKQATELSPSVYIEAKNFLNDLDQALTALRQQDVGNHFRGIYALKARTIPELVKHMTDHGLQFAPAQLADRAAYTALHQALANYGPPVQMQAVERKSQPPEVAKRAY
jgi:hypothetical protein